MPLAPPLGNEVPTCASMAFPSDDEVMETQLAQVQGLLDDSSVAALKDKSGEAEAEEE